MPWTEDDFSSGSDEGEAAITSAGPEIDGQPRILQPDNPATLMVLPRDDHWIIRHARARRIIAAFTSRDQAISRARRLAAETDADLVIHE